MARTDPRQKQNTVLQAFTGTILDRLTDPRSAGTATRPGYSEQEVVNRLHRDLRLLFNSTAYAGELDESLVEARQSMLLFGLPDLGGELAEASETRELIRQRIEDAIIRFEPRLQNVRVSLVEDPQLKQGQKENGLGRVMFRLEAQMKLDPLYPDINEVLNFDLGSRTVDISQAPAGRVGDGKV